jgi:hypothetical protein
MTMKRIGSVLFAVACIVGIVEFMFGIGEVIYLTGNRAETRVTSDQGTDPEPAQTYSGAMPGDRLCITRQMQEQIIGVMNQLKTELAITGANENFWFGEWARVRAENEALKAENERLKTGVDSSGDNAYTLAPIPIIEITPTGIELH